MAEFLNKLECLLKDTGPINKSETQKAAELIRRHHWETNLRCEGPCLNCGMEIRYDDPCSTHKASGNTWLDGFFRKWASKQYLAIKPCRFTHDIETINGYQKGTVWGYLCGACRLEFTEKLNQLIEKAEEERREAQHQQEEFNAAVIRGQIKASPSKKYRILRSAITKDDIERLKNLPYENFLRSRYWSFIRQYKLYKASYRCELCHSNGTLNVHHRTYEHRGEEHNYLEDLIVLCRNCHAKFHDKLEGQPESATSSTGTAQ